MVETAPIAQTQAGPLRLLVPRAVAAKEIEAQIKMGQAIRGQSIRSQDDLDEARSEKQEWIQRTMELLEKLFSNTTVAEACNDWQPVILPEFAEFSLFIEQFEKEMKHRTGRLQQLMKKLEQIPAPGSTATMSIGQVMHAVPADPPQPAAPQPEEVEAAAPVEQRPAPQAAAPAPVRPATPERKQPAPPAPSAPVQRPAAEVPMQTVTMMESETETSGVVILQGVDEGTQRGVSEFLQAIGLSATVVQQKGDASVADQLQGIEEAGFAILLSGGGNDGGCLFELGFCVGRLGAGRVCVLSKGNSQIAGTYGITQMQLDAGETWHFQLARHLKRSGLPIDMNKLA